jgi:release factor glutamine methyltransferase
MRSTPGRRLRVAATLRAGGSVFAEDEADLLLAVAATPAELDALIQRRVKGMPLEQVVGWADFCGLRVAVDQGVFVPRARTELLAREAIRLARRAPGEVVVDLCCGSGAVGVALIEGAASIELYATDIDPVAVGCARRNLGAHGQVFEGDLYTPLPPGIRERVDVLVANVPYVPTDEIDFMPREAREGEARLALDGGTDGLDVLRRVVAGAPEWLAPSGSLLVEVAERQSGVAVEVFAGAGLDARVATSEELEATVVIGKRPA